MGEGRSVRPLLRLLLAVGLGLCVLSAQAATADCIAASRDLAPVTQVLEDAAGTLTPDAVLQQPGQAWHAASIRTLQPGYSSSAWWLRIHLRNPGAVACEARLLAGPAQLRDVQAFIPRAEGGWLRQVAGPAHPLRRWSVPLRQPVFPLTLPAGAEVTVLLRITSPGTRMAFTPQLWSRPALERQFIRESLVDGMVFGAMLLLACFGVALGWVFRRPRLVYIALGVLLYSVYVGLLYNYGYIHLWPGAGTLNRGLMRLALGLTFVVGNLYFCDVIRVARLGRGWSLLFAGVRLAYLLLALGNLWIEPSLWLSILLGLDSVARVLFTVAVAINLRHRALGWYPPTLILLGWLEPAMRAAYKLGLHTFYTADNHMFSTTVLPGGVILIATLISQMAKARRNELRATVALDHQRETEQARLAEIVQLRTTQLQQALHARSALLARIEHDLRAPLAAMLDAVRQWRAGVGGRDFPGLIEREARHQMELIDELVEFSRDELAELELIETPGYLHSFLHDVGGQAQLMAERHGNRLECRFAGHLPAVVVADFRRLRQVLLNVLGNAAKFTHDGRIVFAVEARSLSSDAVCLVVAVEDNGIGIPPAEREHLMLPFVRGSNAAGREGSGLGLAIVAQLLQLMGSALRIEDAAEGGSRFAFELPLSLAHEVAVEPELGTPESLVDGAGRAVLVVDDQRHHRELLCDLLGGSGFEPMAAADGQEALRLLHDTDVSLVLTDQRMAGMDGWRLLAALRAQRPGLPVLLHSALPPHRPPGLAPELAFDACVLKPVQADVLLAQVAKLLDDDLSGNEADMDAPRSRRRTESRGAL